MVGPDGISRRGPVARPEAHPAAVRCGSRLDTHLIARPSRFLYRYLDAADVGHRQLLAGLADAHLTQPYVPAQRRGITNAKRHLIGFVSFRQNPPITTNLDPIPRDPLRDIQ